MGSLLLAYIDLLFQKAEWRVPQLLQGIGRPQVMARRGNPSDHATDPLLRRSHIDLFDLLDGFWRFWNRHGKNAVFNLGFNKIGVYLEW